MNAQLPMPYRASLRRKSATFLFALFLSVPMFLLTMRTQASESLRLPLHLHETAQVDLKGVYLDQILSGADPSQALPHIRLVDAPRFGEPMMLTRQQISNALANTKHPLAFAPITGAETVTISRRSRIFSELELTTLLTETLQADHVVEGGQVEIEFNRPWDPTPVPDEPFDLRLNNFPASGIAPYLILKFDLNNGEEIFGRFQVSLRIKVMKEVWVSDAPISRGDLVTPYVLKKESLDVLRMRDFLDMEFTEDTPDLVAVQGIAKGSPLTSRLLKERPLVKRGDLVEAWVQTGKITVNMKAEALENGINGQLIRLRNPVTKRYLRGKVTGEQMVIIPL